MSMSRISIVLVFCVGHFPLFAQQPPPSNSWEQTSISLGLQTSSGESTYIALNSAIDWCEQYTHVESDMTANASVSQSEGSRIFDAEGVDWPIRWTPVNRKNRFFPMMHLWFEHGEVSGIDFRGAAGPGIGSHVIDNAKMRLTLEAGFARTIEKQIADSDYNTIFVEPTFRWNINKKVSLKNKVASSFNMENRDDIRLHSETDLNFQLTQMVSVSNSVIVDYDSDPVRGHRNTYVQTSINLSISIYKGDRPQ
jgi:putative salt-induced outer membrane protein YdiY